MTSQYRPEPNQSVSWGTMRSENLLPTFLDELELLDETKASDLRAELPTGVLDDETHEWWDSHEPAEVVDQLFDALQEYAPEGCYFGSHPGDGSDYGYWQHEDFGYDDE
jgi:hypothetical protein